MTDKRTLVSFDWAIKYILRDKANFDVLEGFLSTLLKQDITITALLESESNQQFEDNKFNRVDLAVENERGELMVVEVQSNRESHYFARLLYGSSKLIVDHLRLGEPYSQVKKVISVSILYFLLGEGEDDYVYHGTTDFYGLNTQQKLLFNHRKKAAVVGAEVAEPNIFPEYYLIEVERFQNVIQSELDEWIYFLKNSEIRPEFRAKNIQQAQEKLDLLKMPPDQRRAYERFMENWASEQDQFQTAFEDGKAAGFEDGKAAGFEAGIVATIHAMLRAGLEISVIAGIVQRSEAYVLEIREQRAKN